MKVVKRGNKKVHKNTMICNLCSAYNCPAKKKGLCLATGCYADRDERLYGYAVLNYRSLQEKFWALQYKEIEKTFDNYIKNRKGIKYFRLNESGDFKNLLQIKKVDMLSKHLKQNNKIISFCHSARMDLFRKINPKDISFNVRISGYKIEGYPYSVIVDKNLEIINKKCRHLADKSAIVCPAIRDKSIKCMLNCTACVTSKKPIYFIKH